MVAFRSAKGRSFAERGQVNAESQTRQIMGVFAAKVKGEPRRTQAVRGNVSARLSRRGITTTPPGVTVKPRRRSSFQVVADGLAFRNPDALFDDRPPDLRMPADVHVVEQNGIFDVRKAVDADAGSQNTADDLAPGDDAAGTDDAVQGVAFAPRIIACR